MLNISTHPQANNRLHRWSCKLEVVLYLATARFLIKFIPFRYWRNLMGPIAAFAKEPTSFAIGDRDFDRANLIGRYVREMARRVPFDAVCLPQAIAARWALSRRGLSNDLYIGARIGETDKPIDLHAWLMIGEKCLTGNQERLEFEAFQDRRKSAG